MPLILRSVYLFLFIVSIMSAARAQVKDIFSPDLYGQVKTSKEYIINKKDTLRVLEINYSKDGIRTYQHTVSHIPGTPFVNSTICWRRHKDTVTARNCNNDSLQNSEFYLNTDGTTKEMDVAGKGLTISYIPEYNEKKLLKALNSAKSENHTFQFFATATYIYTNDGKILKTVVQGGDQPQGTTVYTYNGTGRLTKSVRSDKDGNQLFEITYIGADDHGNWVQALYQNGLKVHRVFTYY